MGPRLKKMGRVKKPLREGDGDDLMWNFHEFSYEQVSNVRV
jgi:hypothetical protein